mgnify:CR=1 FL=1|tara:strand:+ start:151 stop:405 length:255 start_codon:yes stop_codon:yes gene_type:complete
MCDKLQEFKELIGSELFKFPKGEQRDEAAKMVEKMLIKYTGPVDDQGQLLEDFFDLGKKKMKKKKKKKKKKKTQRRNKSRRNKR